MLTDFMTRFAHVRTLQILVTLLSFSKSLSGQVPAAAPPSLETQLRNIYRPSVVSPEGLVASQGAVLTLVHGGLTASPFRGSYLVCVQTFHEGRLERSNRMCQMTAGPAMLADGAAVEVTRIQVDDKKGTVRFDLVDSPQDPASGAVLPAAHKAAILFEFPKGALAAGDAGMLTDVIDQELRLAPASGQGGGSQPQPQGIASPQGTAAPAGQAQPQAQQAPATVQLGMTREQVIATLGQPTKIVNVGPKTIFTYPDLKIIFQNNQVADVQ